MGRTVIAPTYEDKWIETIRPQPLSSTYLEQLISRGLDPRPLPLPWESFSTKFIQNFENWVFGSKLNSFTGYHNYQFKEICCGCTQYIDNLYMKYGINGLQVIEGDYRYHSRLNPNIKYVHKNKLIPNTPLIISLPFPATGTIHHAMNDILQECIYKNIDVHIDGAWITCVRDITFDFEHPAIKTFAISLSKGLGLGWNRVAIRWSKSIDDTDSITIMNKFNMICKVIPWIADFFMQNCQSDYLWNNFGDYYYKICNDFNLVPTHSIHIAIKNNQVVGISPLIRYLSDFKNAASGI